MSDPAKQASEEAKDTTSSVDTNKYVPKEEYEKLSGSVKELEAKLDEAKLSLLDPEYIAFLETKKGQQVEKKVEKAFRVSDAEIERLSSKQLLELAVERAKEAVIGELSPDLEKRFKKYDMSLADIFSVFELQQCEKKYKDFDDFRGDVRKILESTQAQLTIEQAYKQAKFERMSTKEEHPETTKVEPAKVSSEKPTGTVPSETMQTKAFKNKTDAAEDAWNQVIGAGRDSL
jgi:hypothetical protein